MELQLMMWGCLMATTTGVDIITRACKMFGLVISGKKMLPYFITAAPAKEPAPSFNIYFQSSCL